jgi:L-rhamnose mutarotase
LDFGLIWETKLSALFDADKIRMIPSALMLNTEPMKRYGSVIRVRPEKLEEYKRLHAEVWPGVRKMIAECGLRNYSIYYKDGYLFSYYEYVGDDYEADMAKMAADPETQRWWAVCEPCQEPLETRAEGEWWASMEEVFHQD